jgi:P27 family predicted phage terminase small subunit
VPELEKLGLLAHIDRGALAGYCACWSRWVQAEEAIEAEGLTFSTPNGFLQQRPEVGIANQALRQMHRFAAEFGMTPAARTRISVEPPKPKDADPWDELAHRRTA